MFLTRSQVITRLDEMPKQYRKGIIPQSFEAYAIAEGYLADKLEVRVRLLEEGVARWFCADKDHFMQSFMEAFNFDWADVRELKKVTFPTRSEAYRTTLIALLQPDTPKEELENLWAAMRLTEHWLRTMADERPDGYQIEFDFAAAAILCSAPKRVSRECIIGQFALKPRHRAELVWMFACTAIYLRLLTGEMLLAWRLFVISVIALYALSIFTLFSLVNTLSYRAHRLIALDYLSAKNAPH